MGKVVGGDSRMTQRLQRKGPCFFVAVSLKRECSRFPVAIETSQGQSSTAGDVHCRDLIVEGEVGLALRVPRVASAVLEGLGWAWFAGGWLFATGSQGTDWTGGLLGGP